MKTYKVTFKDKASGTERVYKPKCTDETIAWQWVDKQRESLLRAFDEGKVATNPKTWKVTVEAA